MKFEGVIWDDIEAARAAIKEHIESGGFKKGKTFWLAHDEPNHGVIFFTREPALCWDVVYKYEHSGDGSSHPWYRSRSRGRNSRVYQRGFWMFDQYWTQEWSEEEETYGAYHS